MRFLILILLMAACKSNPAPVTPDRVSLSSEMDEVTVLPAYQGPSTGAAQGVSKGDVVPFDGVLFDENKTMAAASLRISYDEVYNLALANRKSSLVVIRIQEEELARADKALQAKEDQLKKIRDSWWANHKMVVGIFTGVVLGASFAIGSGVVWSKIKD